ncbi:MAG: cbb3-type cytochrome c oxidase subunit 3 [Myxococcales bacterium]|nr:cbb3-type cytochrome c oxidase subunit 3 [Myxococcales bacterium]
MSRFASEFFEQSPVLLYPLLALGLFFIVFLVVIVRVMRMKSSEVNEYARIPLEEESEVPHE